MVIPVGVWLPIQDLPRGNYRLEVQAFDSEGQQTQWQPSEFKIE
jgi:predicted phage tail protein